jgi:serine phosphatase RsbU (regulator of sigma subunit)
MPPRPPTTPTRSRGVLRAYAGDLSPEELSRLFTRDARAAYRFFTQGLDQESLAALPWHRRWAASLRAFFLAFSMRLTPARRVLYASSLVLAALGILELFTGFGMARVPAGLFWIPVPVPTWRDGTLLLIAGFLLVNLLVVLEVADRLTLKDDLEVARDIQEAMLRRDTYRAAGVEAFGATRPANTVGGDFYEIVPLDDGRLVVAIGDVAGKGSPAALLMALLLAMLRTLLDEALTPPALVERLNAQIARHAPPSRFITLFFGVFDPASGLLTYVNAGHLPPLLRRTSGEIERLLTGGTALGLARMSRYEARETMLMPGDVLLLYSDGITEAEDPAGAAFDEQGLGAVLERRPDATAPDLCGAILAAVRAHARDTRVADDLTVVALRRLPPLPVAAR